MPSRRAVRGRGIKVAVLVAAGSGVSVIVGVAAGAKVSAGAGVRVSARGGVAAGTAGAGRSRAEISAGTAAVGNISGCGRAVRRCRAGGSSAMYRLGTTCAKSGSCQSPISSATPAPKRSKRRLPICHLSLPPAALVDNIRIISIILIRSTRYRPDNLGAGCGATQFEQW
jgi:hypothetical protein